MLKQIRKQDVQLVIYYIQKYKHLLTKTYMAWIKQTIEVFEL